MDITNNSQGTEAEAHAGHYSNKQTTPHRQVWNINNAYSHGLLFTLHEIIMSYSILPSLQLCEGEGAVWESPLNDLL